MAEASSVVLDTSILLSIPENKVRVLDDIGERLGRVDFFVTSSVLRELELLEKRKGKRKGIAVIREVLKANKVRELKNGCKNADDCLAEKAGEGFIVATSDSDLKKRIKGFGGRIIYLKKGKLVGTE